MSWTPPATAIGGSVLTAAFLNLYYKDNLNALAAGYLALISQASNDFLYAASSTQIARLAAVADRFPKFTAGAWTMAKAGLLLKQSFGFTATEVMNDAVEYISTGLTASIVVDHASNHVWILASQHVATVGAINTAINMQLWRTGFGNIKHYAKSFLKQQNASGTNEGMAVCVWRDTPGSTGSKTYETRFNCEVAGEECFTQFRGAMSGMILAEVDGT